MCRFATKRRLKTKDEDKLKKLQYTIERKTALLAIIIPYKSMLLDDTNGLLLTDCLLWEISVQAVVAQLAPTHPLRSEDQKNLLGPIGGCPVLGKLDPTF